MLTHELNKPRISLVLQFSLLIIPIVMNCFFAVYSLVGWILEGRDKLNWSLEATEVATWVGISVVVYSLLVMALVRFSGADKPSGGGNRYWHILNVSSIGHILIAIVLTVSVFITVKL